MGAGRDRLYFSAVLELGIGQVLQRSQLKLDSVPDSRCDLRLVP